MQAFLLKLDDLEHCNTGTCLLDGMHCELGDIWVVWVRHCVYLTAARSIDFAHSSYMTKKMALLVGLRLP